MKHIFFLISAAIFYTATVNAQECGSIFAGPIIQQVTKKHSYVEGLLWRPTQLTYVDKKDPHVCLLLVNGTNECHELEGITEVSSIHSIKDNTTHKVLFADKKAWLWNPNTLQLIRNITSDQMFSLAQSTTDNKGRTFIGVCGAKGATYYSKVYKFENYEITEAIPERQINLITGIRFSSDYTNLFIADALKGIIYMYSYDSNKGVVGKKKQVVYERSKHREFPGTISTIAVTKNNELWISTNDSAVISLYDWKKKQIVQSIKIPSRNPTSISYGGSNMNVLFVGTKKPDEGHFDLGGGVIYAVSGTGTQGFQEGFLPSLKKFQKSK